MNIATVIAIIALVVVVFLVIRYLVKEKKKGNKCIGCPYAEGCQKYTGCDHQ
ncbi:MAG: FeoB-associated Cys-rich membrane protein [Bacillota bacterium]|nr:FeoB-associated Cys-rich membrane protein [Bacillota bacterium]